MKRTAIVNRIFFSVFLFLLIVMVAQQVYALPTLKFFADGYSELVIKDESALDTLQGTPGVVGYSGAYGDFIVNVTTGLTKPERVGETTPVMDLSSVNVSSFGSASLDIWFTEDSFGPVSPSSVVTTTVGGTTNGSVSFASYIDNSNTAFGIATETESAGCAASTENPNALLLA